MMSTPPAPPVGVFVGLTTLDVVHRVRRVPQSNEKITATRQDISAGGPAANAAVVFATMGGRARLVTSLGANPIARIIRADLESHGVQITDVGPDLPTAPAVSSIAVTDGTGERSVISVDAADRIVPAPADLHTALDDADVLLIDGHHPALAAAAVRLARAEGITVMVDAGRWKPAMRDLLPLADEVICSADFRWPGTTTADESAMAVQGAEPSPPPSVAHPPTGRLVATTNGAAPIQWWAGGRTGFIPVPPVTAVDTLGAGDALHGAYAFLRASSRSAGSPGSMTECLVGAARVAALRCSIVGPRAWLRELSRAELTKSRTQGADRS